MAKRIRYNTQQVIDSLDAIQGSFLNNLHAGKQAGKHAGNCNVCMDQYIAALVTSSVTQVTAVDLACIGIVELPKLPVPALETTLSKYLQMARVLLTEPQYERTRANVRSFGSPGGVGHRLQRYLLERQQTEENWES
ncbi:hypothetical protein B566_EDAN013693 [Ephemera danica]|nr:hypothetical protein B566_EDAN013693 [Ephemera danica]